MDEGGLLGNFQVTKQIEFCYGHRLLNYEGKCQYLHGHNGVVEVEIRSDQLDSKGMVLDFNEIRDVLKPWIDNNLDHRMILRADDPLVSVLTKFKEPLYLMEENPTAENISKLIFQHLVSEGLNPASVRLWETSSSHATYTGPVN